MDKVLSEKKQLNVEISKYNLGRQSCGRSGQQ